MELRSATENLPQADTSARQDSATTGSDRPLILLIEDDASIQQLVRLYLEQAGYGFAVASTGDSGLARFTELRPALVILDLMLPGMDGWSVCVRIRDITPTPILMLTALRDEEDRLRGFDLGADDYLTKPFSPRELVRRVQAILRRVSIAAEPHAPEPETLTFGALVITPGARRVEVHGERIELRAKEYDLLLALAHAPDQVLSREELLRQVWGFEFLGDSRTVDVHMGLLRKKLEGDPGHPTLLVTVRGAGYRLDPSGGDEAANEGTSDGSLGE